MNKIIKIDKNILCLITDLIMDLKSLKLLIKNDESLNNVNKEYYNWIIYSLEYNKHIIIENIEDKYITDKFIELAHLYNRYIDNNKN
jgi:hypothetical protein